MITDLEYSDGISTVTVNSVGDKYLCVLWHGGTVVDTLWSEDYNVVKEIVNDMRSIT